MVYADLDAVLRAYTAGNSYRVIQQRRQITVFCQTDPVILHMV